MKLGVATTTRMENKWDQCFRYTELMLERRGYDTKLPLGESAMAYLFQNATGSTVLVWYFCFDKLNIDSIKEFIHMLETNCVEHGIIVYQSTVTSSTRKVIDNLYQFKIELFELKELQYDLTSFRYFCQHDKLDTAEAVKIKQKFGTSLPTLLRTDPVVRYYHFQKGEIIRITRRNDTQIYRLVK